MKGVLGVRRPTRCHFRRALQKDFLGAAPGSLWSWGRLGHRASSMLAESRLTSGVREAIRQLLGPGEDIADISTWADGQCEIPKAASWHYVNVPITESRYDAKFCQKNGCVVSKIEDFKRVLMNPNSSRKDKREALKFLVHFVQDLHQPLHIGDNGDRGGNNLQVRWFGIGTNLHRLLDTQIMSRYSLDEEQWARELTALATPEKSKEWSRGSLADWATESLEAATMLYHLPGSQKLLKSGIKLGQEYNEMALQIIHQQLARAGVRVAYMLNEIFR
jgi:nuclease S1